ncbi:MAG: hypothetical protein M3282_02200, partial [Gemmatimonadota bacterium]|nr:hypothetical protein [Gemmatimonadota bacterium]
VRPAVHAHGRQVRVPQRELDALVGHEHGLQLQTVGGPEADLLHDPWGGVGVDPELHAGGR